jgi:tryptophanyl-tRNA synthetase
MSKQRILTGITTTGTPHLGNYVGAIRPAIAASKQSENESFFFLADYHALIKSTDPKLVQQSTKEIAATWLALGLDTEKATFYRQSDVPEITELCWMLTCVAGKGLMNRSHAYKAAVDVNQEKGDDPDMGVTMGLFSYPILMTADILMFNAHKIPVGKDQLQHLEMARDIAQRFNHIYGQHFVLPEAVVGDDESVLVGLDGRKMSKSYGNTIPLFSTEKKLQKSINKVLTNLLEPGEVKDTSDSAVFQLWQAFASEEQVIYMSEQFAAGIGWGQAKKELFALINEEIKDARERYNELMEDGAKMEEILQAGAVKARNKSRPLMAKIRESVGIGRLAL